MSRAGSALAWMLAGLGALLGGCASAPGEVGPAEPSVAEPGVAELWVADRSGLVSVHEVDVQTGEAQSTTTLPLAEGVEFLTFHPQAPWVYVLGRETIDVVSWDGRALTLLGRAPIPDPGTHLALDRTGRWLFVASYGNDSVQVYPVDANGIPGALHATLGGDGLDVCPNAHQVRVHPDNHTVYAPCLGADGVRVMPFDAATGTLGVGSLARLPAGSGPRHMAFHPDLDVAYVWNELASTLSVVDVDRATGALSERATLPAVPEGAPPSRSSDVQVAADGHWLVGIHREPRNELVGFALDARGDPKPAWRCALDADHARTCAVAGSLLAVGVTRGREVQLYRLRGLQAPLPLRRWETPGDVLCVLLRAR